MILIDLAFAPKSPIKILSIMILAIFISLCMLSFATGRRIVDKAILKIENEGPFVLKPTFTCHIGDSSQESLHKCPFQDLLHKNPLRSLYMSV